MFSYSQLNREASEIRLVQFKEPASANPATSPIELELRSASLDDDTHYAAISYAWGRPDASTAAQIRVNGGSVTIGREIHVALARLRQNGVRSWLWVDSICINQPDLEEKSWQVAQMRSIFSRADRVYIWLGPGSSETDKAMDFVSRVGPRALVVGVLDMWWSDPQLQAPLSQYIKERASSPEVPDRHDESSPAGRELADFFFDILHEPDLNARNFNQGLLAGIEDIMRREYWHRVWIIQEISLAHAATVLCGEKAVELEHFDATFSAILFCLRFGLRRLCPETRDFAYGLSANFYENIALSTRRQHRQRDQLKFIGLASIVFQTGVPPGRPHYSATDARDIVFGLLGVVTDGEALGLRVDYNMTLAGVFTALTRALVYDGDENRGTYHLDRCVPKQEGDPSPDLLPSWVPDWRAIGKRGAEVYPINYRGNFDATARAPAPPRPSNVSEDDIISGLLRRPGCRVDVITEVMQPPQWKKSSEWMASYIVDVDGWLASIREFAKLGRESGPGEDYVWRTIMRDLYDGYSRPNKFEAKPMDNEKAALVRKLLRRMPIDLETLTEAQREYISHGIFSPRYMQSEILEKQLEFMVAHWPETIGSVDRGRTLFKTTKGMFGLGHVAIRPGDVVSLLWGVGSPIVLRPRNDGDGGGFTFAGDAYVDGIMYGEFLETMPAHEDFEIY